MTGPGEAHPAWCARLHGGPVHATLPVTIWNADGVRITTSAEQQPDEGALPDVAAIVMSATGVTWLQLPLHQAQALQVGLYSLLMKVENIGPRRPIMSMREALVKTLTIRDGKKTVEKRVTLALRANPGEPLISLTPVEARALGRRLAMEADAVEGGVR